MENKEDLEALCISLEISKGDLITMTGYLFLGYNFLILNWLSSKGVKTREDFRKYIKPIVISNVRDLNTDPRIVKKGSENLDINKTISYILKTIDSKDDFPSVRGTFTSKPIKYERW